MIKDCIPQLFYCIYSSLQEWMNCSLECSCNLCFCAEGETFLTKMSNKSDSSCKIKNFTEFLEKCLGKKISSYILRPLTKPGDNFGSTIQSVEVKLCGGDSSEVSQQWERSMHSIFPSIFLTIRFSSQTVFCYKNSRHKSIFSWCVQTSSNICEGN